MNQLPANRFPDKLVPNITDNMLRNPPFYSFASFSFVSLTPYFNKSDSPRDLTICMISCISFFKIISVVIHDP